MRRESPMAYRKRFGPEVSWRPLLALFSASCVMSLHPASAADPVFTNTPYVATLYEKQGGTTTVLQLPCTDADSDPTHVTLPAGGVTPDCQNCFSVLPCTAPTTGYCLVYYADDAVPLSQQSTPTFSVSVQCSDGTNTVAQTVLIVLTRSSPPAFLPHQFVDSVRVEDARNVAAGTVIYDVNATDANNDNIVFSMTTDPHSDNFHIGSGDGIIRAKNALSRECTDFITFYVTISDGINDPVGPLAIHTTLDGSNQKPDMTNLDVTLQVPEDEGQNQIYTIQATDDTNVNSLTYTLTASPSANLAYYELNGRNLRVTGNLNYETSTLRTTDLTFVASDGFCTSEPRNIRVILTDVNEPFTIQPHNAAYSVYEGPDFGPDFEIDWDIDDEDLIDSHTFEIVGDASRELFSIDRASGQLSVNGDYDIDNSVQPTAQTVRVRVTDKGGLTDTTTVTLNFQDRNDKYPEFNEGNVAYTVCPSRNVGSTLGTLICTDEDLTSPNNDVYITGGGSGLTILPGGSIIMSTLPALGQTITATASCSDRGQYPRALTSVTPVPVSVTTVDCPTTAAPTNAPTTTAPPTTSAPTTTTPLPTDNVLDWPGENLWWLVLAGILLLACLALITYMCHVYCCPYCRHWCSKRWCARRPSKLRPRQPKIRAITPVEMPHELVVSPAIMGHSDLYNFWKEKYPDTDHKNTPDRKSKPRPVSPDRGDQGADSGKNGGKANKKRRCCIIL